MLLLQLNEKAVCVGCERDPRCRLSFRRAAFLGLWLASQVSLCRVSAFVIRTPHVLAPRQPEKHHAVRFSPLEDGVLNLSFVEPGEGRRCNVTAALRGGRAEDLSWSGASVVGTCVTSCGSCGGGACRWRRPQFAALWLW